MDKAFLVGINAYPECPLQGCVNDILAMADYLVKVRNFNSSCIRLLTDARATTVAIVERLEWLVEGVKPGDRVFFHNSCHGAQIATRNSGGEVDGLDEIICPVEFDWTDAHMIRDKQFVAIFSKLPPGVIFNWVADSCHSGDLDRGIPQKPVMGVNKKISPKMVPRAYPVPPDIAWRNRVARCRVKTVGMHQGILDLVGFAAGCKSTQTSADTVVDDKPCGAHTSYLLHALAAMGNESLEKVVLAEAEALKADGYLQEPQAEGVRRVRPFLM